jgi:hypothetical protein
MSDPPPGPAATSGILISVSEKLIRVLPPAFVALLILNGFYLGFIAWIVDHNADARNILLTRIVEQCLLPDRR